MGSFDSLLFWFGSVLAPSLESITFSYIEVVKDRSLIPALRGKIYELIDELRLGKLNGQEFLPQLSYTCGLNIEHDNFYEYMISSIQPEEDLVRLLSQLETKFTHFYISDWPKVWTEKINFQRHYQDILLLDDIIYSQDFKLEKLMPDILYHSINKLNRGFSNCIFIDENSIRTSAAVRSGLNTIIFSDASRFRRELALRKLMD